jgi:arginase
MTTIAILGAPMDLGAGRRGVDMGPSALRLAKLSQALSSLGHTVTDYGNVEAPVVESLTEQRGLHYVEAIAATCQAVCNALRRLPPGSFPIVLGGDHSIAMGSIAGVIRSSPDWATQGVIWIDAHADVNTPATSPSGNIHGMPLAHLLGFGDERLLTVGGRHCLKPENVVFIGLRSVDAGERQFLRSHKIRAFSMKDVDRLGIAAVAEHALEHLAHTRALHVSFDADVLDPSIAPGVGTPVPGGLSYREAHLLMELLADAKRVTSLDLVEVNPILDTQNQTAQILTEMAASLLGKTIL